MLTLPGQKVIAQQLVTSSIAQGQLKAAGTAQMTRPVSLTQEDLNRLTQQQLNKQKLAAGTSVAQIHHAATGQVFVLIIAEITLSQEQDKNVTVVCIGFMNTKHSSFVLTTTCI